MEDHHFFIILMSVINSNKYIYADISYLDKPIVKVEYWN